jgi:hypothetical protein
MLKDLGRLDEDAEGRGSGALRSLRRVTGNGDNAAPLDKRRETPSSLQMNEVFSYYRD